MSNLHLPPKPLFDTLEQLIGLYKALQQALHPNQTLLEWLQQCYSDTEITVPDYAVTEFQLILNFLYSYRGSADTFNAYRRELERFVSWCWFVQKQSILLIKRLDIEAFLEFCQKPPQCWIGIKTVARFHTQNGLRTPNPEWRPFIAKVSKAAFQDGQLPDKKLFKLSNTGIKQVFVILGSFYQFLIQEEATQINPFSQIRQKRVP